MNVGTELSLAAGNLASDLPSGDITGFGLLVETELGTRRFDTFQIDATVIPEPASAALLIGAGLWASFLRRRTGRRD